MTEKYENFIFSTLYGASCVFSAFMLFDFVNNFPRYVDSGYIMSDYIIVLLSVLLIICIFVRKSVRAACLALFSCSIIYSFASVLYNRNNESGNVHIVELNIVSLLFMFLFFICCCSLCISIYVLFFGKTR